MGRNGRNVLRTVRFRVRIEQIVSGLPCVSPLTSTSVDWKRCIRLHHAIELGLRGKCAWTITFLI